MSGATRGIRTKPMRNYWVTPTHHSNTRSLSSTAVEIHRNLQICASYFKKFYGNKKLPDPTAGGLDRGLPVVTFTTGFIVGTGRYVVREDGYLSSSAVYGGLGVWSSQIFEI